jgi:hypothetical protein
VLPYGSLSRSAACAGVRSSANNFLSENMLQADQADIMVSCVAAYAYASNDRLLTWLGVSIGRAMEANNQLTVSDVSSAALTYCDLLG